MGFQNLLDIIELLFELAPVLLALSIFILILKMLDISMNSLIIFVAVILGVMLVNPFMVNGNAEPITDNYTDKRGFDYMNICNTYICINETEYIGQTGFVLKDSEWLDNNKWSYLNSSVDGTKPTKILQWDDNQKQQLILVSKMVYNWTSNDVIKIRFRYIPFDLRSQMVLRVRYSEYIDENRANNVSGSYNYIQNGYAHYQSVYDNPQTTMQRFSNIDSYWSNRTFLGEPHYNPYKFYDKRYGENNTIESFNVSLMEYEYPLFIDSYEPQTLTLNPENFYDFNSDSVLSSYNFINLGIIKEQMADTIIIDSIEIRQKKIQETFKDKPATEIYEFRALDNPRKSRILMSMNLIRNDYSTLYVDTLIIGIDYSVLPEPYLYYNISGHDYTANVTFSNYYTAVAGNGLFIGYQLSSLYDSINGTYSFMIINKYQPNLRNAVGNVFYYYETKFIYCYLDYGYSHILSIEHYENYENTDLKLTHTSGTSKFDQTDNAFSKIDVDLKGDTLLVKDVDNAGFRFPSLNDLGKMVFNVIKPIFGVLQTLQDTLLTPIDQTLASVNDLISSVEVLDTVIDEINGFIEEVRDSVDAIDTIIANIETLIGTIISTISSIQGFVNNLLTTLQSFYDTFMLFYNYVGGLKGFFQTLLDTIIQMLDDMTTTFIAFLTNASSTIVTYWDLTFSIIGVTFSYFLIFKMVKFGETGDLMDLWGIFEVMYMIAIFIKSLFELLWSVIP